MSKPITGQGLTPRQLAADTSTWGRHLPRPLLSLLLVLALFGGMFARPAAAKSDESRVLPQLQQEAAAQPDKSFRVIVTRLGKDKGGDRHVNAKGGKKLKDLPHDAFVAEISGKEIKNLGRNPSVKFVAYDAPMQLACASCGKADYSKLVNIFPKVVNATNLWNASATGSALTGAGVGVAVLDTGISSLNDWKKADGSYRIVKSTRFSSTEEFRYDGHGHGTHVAGIIGGNSWMRSSTALQGKYIGVAPEVNLLNVKVSDDDGHSYISDVVKGIDWVIANRQVYNIRVMNLSLVSSVAESYKTSTLAAAVERAWFNGIFVVVASGNAGPNTMGYPPANDPFVMTVGAADPMGTISRADDGMAPWSSYGITQDGISKPDVVAPGRFITAPIPSTDAKLPTAMPTRIVENTYMWLSGTSMAAPVVAGVAALVFQAHPEWTNDQVKGLLQQTATKLGSTDPVTGLFTELPGQGAGQVDAEAAARYTGVPAPANQGLAINEQLVGPDGSVTYSTSTWSTSTWSTSTWSTSTWSTSTWSTSTWSTSTWASTSQWASVEEID